MSYYSSRLKIVFGGGSNVGIKSIIRAISGKPFSEESIPFGNNNIVRPLLSCQFD